MIYFVYYISISKYNYSLIIKKRQHYKKMLDKYHLIYFIVKLKSIVLICGSVRIIIWRVNWLTMQ